jgi:hypothetical protein
LLFAKDLLRREANLIESLAVKGNAFIGKADKYRKLTHLLAFQDFGRQPL